MGERVLPRAVVAAALAASIPVLAACSAKDEPADVVAGKQLFMQKCGACHTLNRAGTKGIQGPNLDQAFQQALSEGFGESAVRGAVLAQIAHPNRNGTGGVKMPAGLVEGDQAHDVAAYVAQVSGKPGQDTGRLARAVRAAGAGKPIAASNGVLKISTDPSGQLAYVTKRATATAGSLKIQSPNPQSTPHDIVIDGLGKGAVVQNGGVSEFDATVEAGKSYQWYCSVPGHKEAGMVGTLT